MLTNLTVDWVQEVMADKGYAFFTKGEYNLNIIGVRDASHITNGFDDTMCCLHRAGGAWQSWFWPCTTDPGSVYLDKPLNDAGVAILVPGQYRGAFRLGYHKGQYEALVQVKPLPVYRGAYDPSSIETGMFGINIHRAGDASTRVDKWSAGCQVFARRADFDAFMRLVYKAIPLWGRTFTYTLLERKDFGE